MSGDAVDRLVRRSRGRRGRDLGGGERRAARLAEGERMNVSRRDLLQLSAGAAVGAGLLPRPAVAAEGLPAALAALKPLTDGVARIGVDEHRARLGRAQHLLADEGMDALIVGPGSSLAYFTGAQWGISERFFGMVLTRDSEPAWV